MDLDQIPTEVLRAEVEAVDAITTAHGWRDENSPICDQAWCGKRCPIKMECSSLCDEYPGWAERKEQYLQRIRAEIESRNITFIPNSDSQEVIAK